MNLKFSLAVLMFFVMVFMLFLFLGNRNQHKQDNLLIDFDIDLVFVEGGCYEMGCGSWTAGCQGDERPAHEVCVDEFYIGKYEITQSQWEKIMNSSVVQQRDKVKTSWPLRGENEKYPMYYVSWEEAREFINKLNSQSGKKYRLPTEAEWEYAARSGGKQEKYSGSDNIDEVAWYENNSEELTHAVGTKSPNGLGIFDMSGNVYEWCEDWYSEDYYKNSPRNNPLGPSTGTYRVCRGGSWHTDPRYLRSMDRHRYAPSDRYGNLGFRLAFSPGQH